MNQKSSLREVPHFFSRVLTANSVRAAGRTIAIVSGTFRLDRAMIVDKNSGTILLQQALRRGLQALPIDSKPTAMGKEERALSVSGYVYSLKYTSYAAFNKISTYKRRSKNHLVDQIENFRMGDKDSKREDDLLDTFCYGIALSLGDNKGFPGQPSLDTSTNSQRA
jgi:hypothetical protein